MKKFIIVIISAVFVFVLSGCSNSIKEYDGTPITKLTYESVDYNGGYTTTYIFDFQNKKVSRSDYMPYETNEKIFETIATFTEEQEKSFMDKCYTYGLFDLKKQYKTTHAIMDGGGWSLVIEYENGSTKTSTGDNASPTKIFNNCSTAFYDLCRDGVVGYVPTNYYSPPEISISFGMKHKNHTFSDNVMSAVKGVNYKWNGFESLGNDLYSISNELNQKPRFSTNTKYTVSLYTANYGDNEKFKNLVLKSYDLNEQLSNEKVVLSKGWFGQVDIALELNKIYVVKLTFKDGDFAEYTFNTRATNQKILFGEYHYSIYNAGHSELKVNEDGSFALSPFKYFDSYLREKGIVVDDTLQDLNGVYRFEKIGSQEYLCLYVSDTEKIVFDYCSKALFLDSSKTNYDVSKYNLTEKNQWGVTFDYSS